MATVNICKVITTMPGTGGTLLVLDEVYKDRVKSQESMSQH
jgi:hypothetical protein